MTRDRGPAGKRGEMREVLIASAQELFANNAYVDVTVRAIAEYAHCDPAMISYYFGSKIGLFREAMAVPGDPIKTIVASFGDGGPGSGERVVATVLDLYSSVDSNFRLYVANLLTKDANYDSFMSYLQDELVHALAAKVPGKNAVLRTQLAFGEVLGLCFVRYIVAKEPLASIPSDVLAKRYGQLVDVTLFGAT
ncbi:TetR family transcriptional regulator [Corynebacterium sp.]|uniref:TetR/AcrR family transcriptional regulator n=1 Tax=Corynebacterium sp. TaxID=1720 RepID=UPI003736E8A2